MLVRTQKSWMNSITNNVLLRLFMAISFISMFNSSAAYAQSDVSLADTVKYLNGHVYQGQWFLNVDENSREICVTDIINGKPYHEYCFTAQNIPMSTVKVEDGAPLDFSSGYDAFVFKCQAGADANCVSVYYSMRDSETRPARTQNYGTWECLDGSKCGYAFRHLLELLGAPQEAAKDPFAR